MRTKKNQEEKIKKALTKKALGYDASEVLEEYAVGEDGVEHLCKRKVASKHFAPDITAIKLLLSYFGDRSLGELELLTDEELMHERDKLLAVLQQE